jgi:hypothetical protein
VIAVQAPDKPLIHSAKQAAKAAASAAVALAKALADSNTLEGTAAGDEAAAASDLEQQQQQEQQQVEVQQVHEIEVAVAASDPASATLMGVSAAAGSSSRPAAVLQAPTILQSNKGDSDEEDFLTTTPSGATIGTAGTDGISVAAAQAPKPGKLVLGLPAMLPWQGAADPTAAAQPPAADAPAAATSAQILSNSPFTGQQAAATVHMSPAALSALGSSSSSSRRHHRHHGHDRIPHRVHLEPERPEYR